jgi:hypothetical protein
LLDFCWERSGEQAAFVVGISLFHYFADKMLLWMPPTANGVGTTPTHTNHNHVDDNEKGDKLRRRAAQARARNTLMVLGLFLLGVFATISQVEYTKRRHTQPSLRSPSQKMIPHLTPSEEYELEQGVKRSVKVNHHEKKLDNENTEKENLPVVIDDFFVPHAHLPENSIYRLTDMTDVTGNSVDLSQFTGLVSLVVNTACL